MELIVDIQGLQSTNTRNRGIDRFIRNLSAAMAVCRPAWQIRLIQSEHLKIPDLEQIDQLLLQPFRPPLPFTAAHVEVNERYYADWLTGLQPDAILIPSFFDDQIIVPQFTGMRPPLYAVLHDLIPLLFHDHYLMEPRDFNLYARRYRQLLRADCVLANSEASARDLRMLAGQECPRTVAVGGAADVSFQPASNVESSEKAKGTLRALGIQREFILYVGGYDYRKNLAGAMKSYGLLPEAYRKSIDLVIVCTLSKEQRAEIQEMARQLGIENSLRLPGFINDEALRHLYQTCRVFFFPSLYEGLGIPVLEAMRSGAPVVASNCAAVPEYAGHVSWLADPRVASEMATALTAALDEPIEIRRRERIAYASQFTWEKAAERACRAFEDPIRLPEVKKRRRLAWVSPLPPVPSGISDYSAELIGHLSSHYEIELVIDPRDPLVAPELAEKFTVLLGNEVATRHEARPFDVFVYQVGNSHYHTYMLDLMRRFPSLLVLHDFFLGGLVFPAIQDGIWPTSLVKELELEGEKNLARSVRTGAVLELDALDHAPLNTRILDTARAIIVHSAWSWQRVRQKVKAPVARVAQAAPTPEPKPKAQMRLRLGLSPNAFLIATLGFVGPPKRIPSLLQAVAALPVGIRRVCEVLIVGYSPEVVQEELVKLAQQLGIAAQVRFLGRVPLDDFAAYARAADVCVQLRYPTRGETSAALLRELAAGAVCVISDYGSIAEIPNHVVLKVRTPHHEVEDLTAALVRLYENPGLRTTLMEAAVRYTRESHNVSLVVKQYQAMIELVAIDREMKDSTWAEWACEGLENCSQSKKVGSLIEPWSALRARNQQRPTTTFPRPHG